MDIAAEGKWSRVQLDADYTAKLTCSPADLARITGEYARLSQAALDLPVARQGIAYDGDRSRESYDLFAPSGDGLQPCFVFIHGGYWRALDKAHSAFMAPMLAAHGIACAVPDYTLAPAVTLTEITRQCRAMLAHLWHHAGEFGIDRSRIVVGGSSAGGHLTGIVAAGGWQTAAGLPEQPLKGQIPVSGLFDLAPLAGSHVNDWMNFSAAEVESLSPLRQLPAAPLPTVVALAERETPGFHRQSAAYGEILGAPVLTIPDRNHFDVVLDWTDPQSALSRALLNLF